MPAFVGSDVKMVAATAFRMNGVKYHNSGCLPPAKLARLIHSL